MIYDIDEHLNNLMNELDKDGIHYLTSAKMKSWQKDNIQRLINGHIESLRQNSNLPSIILY